MDGIPGREQDGFKRKLPGCRSIPWTARFDSRRTGHSLRIAVAMLFPFQRHARSPVRVAVTGVGIVTGDTKVVGKGSADGLFINTAGVGIVPEGLRIGPEQARPGDHIIVSGAIGEHGVAIMSVREGIDFGTTVTTDSAPLHRLVAAMLAAVDDPNVIHALRDPTRGGLVAATVEIARTARVGIELDEARVPIPESVASACGFLGLDPLQVANEGKLVAFVDPAHSEAVLAAMRARPEGAGAVIIGRAVAEHPGMVVARTPFGTTRIVERELGEQLPRIC
jgi:hydrogenase expression/formation protein HypE